MRFAGADTEKGGEDNSRELVDLACACGFDPFCLHCLAWLGRPPDRHEVRRDELTLAHLWLTEQSTF